MTAVKSGLVPRYYRLKQILEGRMVSGEFAPGDRFPTDEELTQAYDLSRGTVRRAVDMLVEEGRLRREQGRGTFVTTPQLSPVFFRLGDFSEEMRHRGRQPGTRLLQRRIFPASDEIADRLQLCSGEDVIEIARLRLADGRPMAYEIRYLAHNLCPGLLDEDLEAQSIHSLLIDKYNIPLTRAVHTIEARALSPQEAALLQVPPGSAGFAVDRLTYTLNNRPVTWYRIIYRGDEYTVTAEFQLPEER